MSASRAQRRGDLLGAQAAGLAPEELDDCALDGVAAPPVGAVASAASIRVSAAERAYAAHEESR
jgi:hypothetical protein